MYVSNITSNLLCYALYSHFSHDERLILAKLVRSDWSQTQIAHCIGKHLSSVSRELARNGDAARSYHVRRAQARYRNRRKNVHKRFQRIVGNDWLRIYIIRKLKKYWSPEQIAGVLGK